MEKARKTQKSGKGEEARGQIWSTLQLLRPKDGGRRHLSCLIQYPPVPAKQSQHQVLGRPGLRELKSAGPSRNHCSCLGALAPVCHPHYSLLQVLPLFLSQVNGFCLHVVCLSKVADTSHVTDFTRRFLTCNANSLTSLLFGIV